MTVLWDLLDNACKETRVECAAWERLCGSVDCNEVSGRVDSRLRYLAVVGSEEDGTGREETS